jgi:type IV pilus assembly protein PilA
MTHSQPPAQGRSNEGILILVVVLIAAPILVALIGILASLAIYGVRKYLVNAKSAEGSAEVKRFAEGMAHCGSAELSAGRELPESAAPVPASLSAVSGRKYMSSTADWSAPAYTCAGFSMSIPQYFQYVWTRRSASSGTVKASADFDGDGIAEVVFERDVTCSSGACTVGIENAIR